MWISSTFLYQVGWLIFQECCKFGVCISYLTVVQVSSILSLRILWNAVFRSEMCFWCKKLQWIHFLHWGCMHENIEIIQLFVVSYCCNVFLILFLHRYSFWVQILSSCVLFPDFPLCCLQITHHFHLFFVVFNFLFLSFHC